MRNLWCQTIGNGNYHLVLLHGWGLNSQVWSHINELLSIYFTLHVMDLPGFGRSTGFGAMTLDEMADFISLYAPSNIAIWLGWSLGGLVASRVALMYPNRVRALITVASSPCFSAQDDWPGIKLNLLADFQNQLSTNPHNAIKHFLILQTIGSDTAFQDFKKLKNAIISIPMSMLELISLNNGLEILKTVDLRKLLTKLNLPHLRIYGGLDSLVPKQIIPLLDTLWPDSKSLLIARASHVPFISHPDNFCKLLINFSHRLN